MANNTAEYLAKIRDESKPRSEVIEVYDQWSESYDAGCLGRTSERNEFLMNLVDRLLKGEKNAKILDLAAGTGFYGQLMHKTGYTCLDAVDGSQKMLDAAKKLNVYTRVVCSFIGTNRLDFPDDSYDLIFCVGSLYENHVTDDCFPELLRIAKPGGHMVFSVLEKSASKRIEKTMQEYHDKSKWNWIERSIFEKYSRRVSTDDSVQESKGLVYVFRKPE